jgi:DNA-directed RNA polymerase specialized sigma24 family protein
MSIDTGSLSLSDAELVRACLDGNRAAWVELVGRYGRLVYSIPRTYGLPPSQADEIFQEVFLGLYLHLRVLRRQFSLARWLIATTLHHVKARNSNRHGPVADFQQDGHPSTDEIRRWEREHWVQRAFAALGPDCRHTLQTVFFRSPPDLEQIGAAVPCFRQLERNLLALQVNLNG